MLNACPVCEFNISLDEFQICSNCGFQSGYDDTIFTIEELQELYQLDNDYFWSKLN